MTVQFVQSIAMGQKNRLIATVMTGVDKTKMSDREKDELRIRVRAAVNVYHDFVLDCLKALDAEQPGMNEEAIRLYADLANQSLEATLRRHGLVSD